MKQKFMIVAVLLGALSLGACVDDNETQSVSEVRNAKAELLQAQAQMNNAAAQAAKIAADAEAKLLAAQAQAQAAQAARAAAEAELINKQNELIALQKEAQELTNEAQKIANQEKQLEVEAALRDLEYQKAYAEKELARIAAEMEEAAVKNAAALATAKKQLLNAQRQLIEKQTKLAENANKAEAAAIQARIDELTELSADYTAAVEKLITAQENLATAQARLAKLETGLVKEKATMEQNIIDNKNDIAYYQILIESFKNYTNYLNSEDLATLQAKKKELNKQRTTLYDVYLTKVNAYNNYEPDYTELRKASDAVATDKFYNFIVTQRLDPNYDPGSENAWWNGYSVIWGLDYWGQEAGLTDPNFFSNSMPKYDYYSSTENYFGGYNGGVGLQDATFAKGLTYELENKLDPANPITNYWSVDSVFIDKAVYTPATVDFRIVELRANEVIAYFQTMIANQETLLKEYQANYNGTATGYYASAGGSETAYAADATEKPNAMQTYEKAKKAYEEDKTNDAALKAAYENALNVVVWLENEIKQIPNNIDNYEDI